MPPTDWRAAVRDEWRARRAADPAEKAIFPLAANPFGEEEILAMADTILTGKLTLGANVERAEKYFAATVGARYAVMVNSGSSANLLAVAAACNPKREGAFLKPGDAVLVPAVCWSTSVFPLIQFGLKPVFVDVDAATLNVSRATLEAAATAGVKALMAVHVLGNSAPMADLLAFVRERGLLLIEDTCESLGSTFEHGGNAATMLGTVGDFGTYSFYFSHHITSGEGGMVVCQSKADFNLLRCLRAHGWTRHLTNAAEVEAAHPGIDPRFCFVNVGFNLRPMEVQGAMLNVQLAKMHDFNACRRSNMARISAALQADPSFASTMSIAQPGAGTDAAWFGIGAVLAADKAPHLAAYLAYLTEHGIENRPIISGNFVRQPVISAFCPDARPQDYPGAEAVHGRGFFIGVHQLPIPDATIGQLVQVMLGYAFDGAKGGAAVGGGAVAVRASAA